MWNYIRIGSSDSSLACRVDRYTVADALAYVLTLCAAGTAVSAARSIPVQRWLGTQWVLGWFALDAVWNPTSPQPRFGSAVEYFSFVLGLVAHMPLLYFVDRTSLDYWNVFFVLCSVVFWCLTEDAGSPDVRGMRTSAKITALYGTAFCIAFIFGFIFDFRVSFPSWVYYFIALQYSCLRPQPSPFGWYVYVSKFLHAWIWAALVYDLAVDKLDFSTWF